MQIAPRCTGRNQRKTGTVPQFLFLQFKPSALCRLFERIVNPAGFADDIS